MDFLKGKRTYILGALVFAQALYQFITGEITGQMFFEQLPEMLGGLGLMTLRAAVK